MTQPGPRPRILRQKRIRKQIAEEQERRIGEADEEIRAQRELPHNSIDPSGQDEISEDLPASQKDYWTCTSDVLTRHHREPRSTLSVPKAESCPLPLEYLDVLRHTETNLSHVAEATIYDHWTRHGEKELSGPWTGRTAITIKRPQPPVGKMWIDGRLTRIVKTTRPPSVWPEIWTRMSDKDKQKEIRAWEIEGPKREESRRAAKV